MESILASAQFLGDYIKRYAAAMWSSHVSGSTQLLQIDDLYDASDFESAPADGSQKQSEEDAEEEAEFRKMPKDVQINRLTAELWSFYND